MSDIPPPEQPGMYADSQGAWWWWDGADWTPAPEWGPLAASSSSRQSQERTQALLMWVLFLVLGGWLVALIFYLVSKEKAFVRHHSAEALNLSLVLLVPQIVGVALMLPDYIRWITTSIDDPAADTSISGTFWVGIAVLGLGSLASYALGIAGAVMAHRGRWWRLPIGLHPVRGVIKRGETPPYDVGT